MPGASLGRYELLMPIAQGGMAAVWAARQGGSRGFEKTVAVKTMLPKLSEDPQFERMFLNEATLATRIQHPNVAQILDLGEHGELLYIVMEWVDGEALSTLMRAAEQAGTHLPRDVAVAICSRACWGLHAAHEVTNENDQNAGIVHRDVSPQNILVAYNGAVKVVDFGVAKASGLPGGETNTGSLKGKVPYMSPEQARCAHIDRRTDVFAIGILLYRLTTGAHPFVGSNDLETLQNIVGEEPVRPRDRDPSISPQLEAVILRCLAKDREHRFATMADVAHAIDACSRHVSEQEISQLITTYLGPKGAQRRAQLKQAAKSLGWATQTSDQMPQAPPGYLGGHTPSHPSVTGPGWPRADVQAPTPSHGTGSTGPTFAAVASPERSRPAGASTGTVALIAGLAVAAVAALVAVGVVLMSKRQEGVAAASRGTGDLPAATAPTTNAAPSLASQAATTPGTSAPASTASAASAIASASASSSAATAPEPHGPMQTAPTNPPATKPPPVKPPSGAGDVDMGF